MTYEHYKQLTRAVETARGWAEGDAYKYIKTIHSTHLRVEDCHALYLQNKFNFVHDDYYTGFILTTVRSAENTVIQNNDEDKELLCFIPLKEVDSVTFDIGDYSEIYTPLKHIFGITVNVNIDFEYDYYEFEEVKDAVLRVKYVTYDPVTVTIGVYDDPDKRDAATDASDSIPIRKPGIYYLKAFAVGPDGASATDKCTVVIGANSEDTIIYFITSEEQPFYTSDEKWLTVKAVH